MKSITAFAITAVLVLGLSALGGNSAEGDNSNAIDNSGAVEFSTTCDNSAAVEISPAAETSSDYIFGGWTVQMSNTAKLPYDEKKVFDKAIGQWNGGMLNAVALLGTQIASGTNYCFLAQSEITGRYMLVYANQDLDGEIYLIEVADPNIMENAFQLSDNLFANTYGGWSLAQNTYARPMPHNVLDLNYAQMSLVGAHYELIATLGTQLVSQGQNSLILCKTSYVTANNAEGLSLVKLYKPIGPNAESGPEIIGVQEFSIG